MKSKVLVALGGIVLVTLIVCVSAYAYNYYASASSSRAYAGANSYGLVDGKVRAIVTVGNDTVSDEKTFGFEFAHGGASLSNDGTKKAKAHAYVEGWLFRKETTKSGKIKIIKTEHVDEHADSEWEPGDD